MSWQVVDRSNGGSNWMILVCVPFQAEGACCQMIPEKTGTVPPDMGYRAFVPFYRQILKVNITLIKGDSAQIGVRSYHSLG